MENYPGESPIPERERGPEVRVFNLDAIGDDELIVLYRGIGAMTLQIEEGINEEDHGIEDAMPVADSLWDALVADVRDLAARDPERVKSLVERCLGSSQEIDHEFVAYTVPGLLDYDYAYTRDTLVSIERMQGNSRVLQGYAYCGGAHDNALSQIRLLIRDRLSPEQIADFQARSDPGFEPDWYHPADPADY